MVGGGGREGLIFFNRMNFRSNPFSLSKLIECSVWYSYIHTPLSVSKMKNGTSFEFRAMITHLRTSMFLSKTSGKVRTYSARSST